MSSDRQETETSRECPECGSAMTRRKMTGATKCSGEWRKSITVKDYCKCGIRVEVDKEIGGAIPNGP
jgi:hypothetical protein